MMAEIEIEGIVNVKKCKIESEDNAMGIHKSLKDLSKFRLKRVLSNHAGKKLLCMEGTFSGYDGAAVLLMEKKPFVEDNLRENFFNEGSTLSKEFENDLYGNYSCFPPVEYNSYVIIHSFDKHFKENLFSYILLMYLFCFFLFRY